MGRAHAWGRRRLAPAAAWVGCVATLCAVTPAAGAAGLPSAPTALPQMWGVEVDAGTLRVLDGRRVRRLRAARMTLVASPGRLSVAGRNRLAALAARRQIPVFAPLSGAAACAETKRANPGSRCGSSAGSSARAAGLTTGAADVVLVRAKSPAALRRLAKRGAGMARVAAVLPLERRGYRAGRWPAAVRAARRSAVLDLVVRPAGSG